MIEDETMMVDDFAMIAAKKDDSTEESEHKQHLRTGLTVATSSVQTLAQLYLALDRPDSINLKYDWVSENAIG